jgi:hypothetical protein
MKNDKAKTQEHNPADTFLALSTILVSCVSGIFLGLYWRVLVLDNLIEMDTAMMSDKLLLALYVPVGVLGVIVGLAWFWIAYKIIKVTGIKVKNY